MLIWPRFLWNSQRNSRVLCLFLQYCGKLCSGVFLKGDGCVCCVCNCSPGKKVSQQFFQKTAILVLPNVFLLSKVYQVFKVGILSLGWLQAHGTTSHRGFHLSLVKCTYSQSRLIKLLQAQRDRAVPMDLPFLERKHAFSMVCTGAMRIPPPHNL